MNLIPSPFFAEAEAGLTKHPIPINLAGIEFNNSIIVSFISALLIIVVVQVAMRSPKLVPSGLQNLIEAVVEGLSNFIESITGRATMERGFWFFGGVFVFIFVSNVISLLPGVGTIGYGKYLADGSFQVTEPFFRGANANVNLTAAYTAIFFFMWFYWAFAATGFTGFFHHIFASKVKFPNFIINAIFVVVFFFVGLIEVFSIIIIRPIAFTFRLYGNIFGGESFLDTIYHMAPNIAFLTLIPAYAWEFVVAFVQAFAFFILSVVFTGILTNNPDHEKDGH